MQRFARDEYHPYTSVDAALLRDLGLPTPLELDDMLPMQQLAREEAVLRAVECALELPGWHVATDPEPSSGHISSVHIHREASKGDRSRAHD